jgi:excisionase family DNA binding protein
MCELISPKKAARMLGVSTNTLRNWEIAGLIFAVKTLGGQRRYYTKDIEKLVESNKTQATCIKGHFQVY